MSENKCPICSTNAIVNNYDHNHIYVECKSCGKYYLKIKNNDWIKSNDKLASYMYYNCRLPVIAGERKDLFAMMTDDDIFEVYKNNFNHCIQVTESVVNVWFPKNIREKSELILTGLYKLTPYFGKEIELDNFDANALFFVKNVNDIDEEELQINNFMHSLSDMGYISCGDYYDYGLSLTIEGIMRAEEISNNDKYNKNVFVSMAFNDSTKETREAIRQGIINAGYSAEFIDEIIHNKQIVPEMFRLIRESRFLILDISDPNYGAYYEAGYALGLGKEVIICCNQDAFSGNIKIDGSAITDEEKEKFGKYLRPHFDIAQKQILVWSDYADLTKKLEEWIKAII